MDFKDHHVRFKLKEGNFLSTNIKAAVHTVALFINTRPIFRWKEFYKVQNHETLHNRSWQNIDFQSAMLKRNPIFLITINRTF